MPAKVFGVVDGMGGHLNGKLAAKIVCDTFVQLTNITEPDMVLLRGVAQEANSDVFAENIKRQLPNYIKMGAVATVAWADPDNSRVFIVHAGDTRAYLFSKGGLQQVTRDDTPLAGMSEEERIHDPRRNYITQAFGLEQYLTVNEYTIFFEPGDILLLCSDGMSDNILPDTIVKILDRGHSAQETAQELLAAVKKSGRRNIDNVTIVIVKALADSNARQAPTNTSSPTCCPV
jgi:protein phosphatase